MGPDRTTVPGSEACVARKSSGLALAMATPWSGSRRKPPYGDGLPAASSADSAATSSHPPAGMGADTTRHRFAW